MPLMNLKKSHDQMFKPTDSQAQRKKKKNRMEEGRGLHLKTGIVLSLAGGGTPTSSWFRVNRITTEPLKHNSMSMKSSIL
jgi:hypothetical protein